MNETTLQLLAEMARREARGDFYAFRQYMNGNRFITGWLPENISERLQQFYSDCICNKKPKLILSMPPQHGKSAAVSDFIAWLFGKNPDFRIMYTSASDSLCKRENRNLRRILTDYKFKRCFSDYTTESRDVQFNSELIELNGRRGSLRTATCGGTIVGETLDIGIIDDPVKGRADANSPHKREIIWNWFLNDFFTRFSENAGFLLVMTRWHVDDLAGRLIEHFGNEIEVIKYQAIAEKDESFRKAGEALFPELKSLDFLETRRAIMQAKGGNREWESLYQQNPVTIGGNIIKAAWFRFASMPPKILYSCITADTAQKTKEHNDFSVFQFWGKGDDGKIYLLDQIRGKWEAPDLKRQASAFWRKCQASKFVTEKNPIRSVYVEDKSSGTGLIQELRRETLMPIVPVQRSEGKYTRLCDVLSYIEAGYVCLLEDSVFVSDFLSECEQFSADDSHDHDDQVDCLIDAIKKLLAEGSDLSAWENFI